ncbi:nucleotide exchange factor GrpE [Magnetovibrio sp. PR-2]|uniref:nucleotide exchange factor GrpE n=1 Tax=Magnetovibrio sp. PR-2 TaxID=3120356 RepID=UPI002FCE30A4
MNTEHEVPAEDVPETPEEVAAAQADAQAEAAREIEIEIADAQEEAAAEQPEELDLEGEIAKLKDQLLRAMAEAENTRRIAAREKTDAQKYAVTNFGRDMLRVADYLSMATMAVTQEARDADSNLNNLCVGIDMTMKELLNVFEGHGIKPIKTDGVTFDHNLHEAISQEENPDVPKGTILRAQRGGFTLKDRLLRPAQVVVATGGPKPENPDAASEADTLDQAPDDAQKAYEGDGAEPGQQVDQET